MLSKRPLTVLIQLVLGCTAVLVLMIAFGCASVPKEAVQLSYAVGRDIQEIHKGYRNTVRAYFQEMRERGLEVIDNQWRPTYLKVNIKESGLFEHLRDTSVPEEERYVDLEYWCRGVLEDLDSTRSVFLDSLRVREDALVASIDEAFKRAIRANATVTAHLNSIVEIHEVQDEILKSAGLLDIRNEINDGIAEASDFTDKAIKEVEKVSSDLEGKR